MNKSFICSPLPVLEASENALKLKLFNVSAKMRKRIRKIAEIVVCRPEFAAIAVKITGKVKITNSKIIINSAQNGVINYLIRNKTDLTKLNPPFQCSLNLSTELEQTVFERAEKVIVNPSNWLFYSKCKFKSVKFLSLDSLRSGQTSTIINSIEQIKVLRLKFCSLEPETAFNLRKLEEIELLESRITGFITLNCLNKLVEVRSSGIWLINCPNVLEISLKREIIDRKDQNWLESNGKLKKLGLKMEKIDFGFENLSKTITNFYFTGKIDSSTAIKSFPQLRILTLPKSNVKLSKLDNTKLKKIEALLENDSTETITLNLREAVVDSEVYNQHPEILRNCSKIVIAYSDFNFSNLPSKFEEISLVEYNLEGENSLKANLFKLEGKTVNLTKIHNISKITELVPILPSVRAVRVRNGFLKSLQRKYPQINIS